MKIFRLFVAFTIICFALVPRAQAVVPAPDGGYPNFTTAEGQNALKSLTTGAGNTAIGWFSLFSATTASFNTGVGAGTLPINTGDNNTATGTAALLLNTTGATNTADGSQALLHNTDGTSNTAVGFAALFSNTLGNANTAIGDSALSSNTADSNAAVGFKALASNTTGNGNTAIGALALSSNTEGIGNTATGLNALFSNTDGDSNTATGDDALLSNTTGGANTANGIEALRNNTTGSLNTAVGQVALSNSTTGSQNIALGAGAGLSVSTADNVICIGFNVTGADTSNTCFIGNIFGATSSGGTAVFINSSGQLGTATSSRRFKDEIKPMEQASEALYALRPVTFCYKKEIDPAGTSQFGLVAEDVENVNPDLVVRDKEGKPYSVRYEQVNAMLLNEFLKAHHKIQELEASNAQQQEQIDALTAGLKEQAAQIQKVSAQLELNERARQVAGNNQ
jgi:hypothetical protein